MPEYKSLPQFTKAIDDRTVEGIFCVHGNIDSGRDRSHPGLFGDFTSGGRKRTVFLWQHDSSAPPIAAITRIYDVAAADLPPAVKAYAPDATGGVAVVRTYLDTPRGNEVLAGLKAGAITEMSYAYDPTRWDYEEQSDGGFPFRNLYAADLMDISDVTWGMNPATSADGTKTGRPILVEHATVLAAVAAYTDRYQQLSELRAKEGRVLSGENRTRIKEAVDALEAARKALDGLLAATDPQKTLTPDDAQLFAEYQRTVRYLNGVLHA